MKTLFSVLAAAAVLGFAAPSNARADFAGETRIVGYTANGAPIIAVYQPASFDAYGRPIYQWVTQGAQFGYTPPRPVYVQPNINLGFGGYNPGCNPGYGYGYQRGYSHHHHGFHR
jgi:hypothetical protein